MQKVRQNDLKLSENQFFVFELLIFFFVNVSSNFVIQNDWTRYPIDVLKIHLLFLIKVPQMTTKLSKKQNCRNFDVSGDFAKFKEKSIG